LNPLAHHDGETSGGNGFGFLVMVMLIGDGSERATTSQPLATYFHSIQLVYIDRASLAEFLYIPNPNFMTCVCMGL